MDENDMNHLEFIEDNEEEALSLRDLPLQDNDNDDNNNDDEDNDNVNDILNESFSISSYSKNDPPEFFEFLANHLTSDNMCPADDIIFCGKLVPFKHQSTIPSSEHNSDIRSSLLHDKRIENSFRRRSESLSELQSFRTMMSRSSSTKVMRNSRSLDSRKLHRLSSSSANTSPESDIERNPSVKSVGRTDSVSSRKSSSTTVKPRWFVFMFGTVKFPPEMELKDIKSRQFRRNQSVMFPATSDGGSSFPVNRSSTVGKSSWKFLKALSCKDHGSVGVTTPFCIPPQA